MSRSPQVAHAHLAAAARQARVQVEPSPAPIQPSRKPLLIASVIAALSWGVVIAEWFA